VQGFLLRLNRGLTTYFYSCAQLFGFSLARSTHSCTSKLQQAHTLKIFQRSKTLTSTVVIQDLPYAITVALNMPSLSFTSTTPPALASAALVMSLVWLAGARSLPNYLLIANEHSSLSVSADVLNDGESSQNGTSRAVCSTPPHASRIPESLCPIASKSSVYVP